MTDVFSTTKYKIQLGGLIQRDLLSYLENQSDTQIHLLDTDKCSIASGHASTEQWLSRTLEAIKRFQSVESLQVMEAAHYIESDCPILPYYLSNKSIDLLSHLNGSFRLLLNAVNSTSSAEELNLDYSTAALVVYCKRITPQELNGLVEEPPDYIRQSIPGEKEDFYTARFEYNDSELGLLELLDSLIPELLDCVKNPLFAKARPDSMWQMGLFTHNRAPCSVLIDISSDRMQLLKETGLSLRIDMFFR